MNKMEQILNPNCSEVIWRLEVKKNTCEEILKALEYEEEDDYETFTTGKEYPDGCIDMMLKELEGAIDIDSAELSFEENQGLKGADNYTENCFKIAKRVIKGKLTKKEAEVLGKQAWKDNVIEDEDDY